MPSKKSTHNNEKYMKRKKNDQIFHTMLNGDSTRWLSPIGKASKAMNEMTPAIEAGGCCIKGLPDWVITIVAHNGYAIIQVHLGETLVASSYVVWAEQGSDRAWRSAMAAHKELMNAFLGKIPEASHIPEKPLAPKWIATLMQHKERHHEIIPHSPRVGSIVTNLALYMIQYYGSLEAKRSKPSPGSDGKYSLMKIVSIGELIVASDYFGGDWENTGKYLVSCNEGAIRLLWPSCRINEVQQMMTADEIIVTRGVYEDSEALEILFDDHSASPFMLVMTDSSVVGFLPGDPGKRRWKFTIWMCVNGRPRMVYSRMAHWRQGTDLPDLRPL